MEPDLRTLAVALVLLFEEFPVTKVFSVISPMFIVVVVPLLDWLVGTTNPVLVGCSADTETPIVVILVSIVVKFCPPCV